MLKLRRRWLARTLPFIALFAVLLAGTGLAIHRVASGWFLDRGIAFTPAGDALASLLLLGAMASMVGGLVGFVRGLLACSRWVAGLSAPIPRPSNP